MTKIRSLKRIEKDWHLLDGHRRSGSGEEAWTLLWLNLELNDRDKFFVDIIGMLATKQVDHERPVLFKNSSEERCV